MIAMVTKETILDGKIKCNRSSEGGSGVIEAALPVLFTTQRGLNEPRYASLPGIMKAKKKPLDIKTPADFGMNDADLGTPEMKILSLRLPPERKAGKIIEGETPEAKAAELVRLLREEAKAI
jgi:electron transfer flavoprotein beta subunit